jgi:uncharacterized protein (TIGR02453 family)
MGEKVAIFSPQTFRFFRELGRNNHKAWMDVNRERYRAHVVGPLRALLDALVDDVRRLNPEFDISGRTGANLSRINRDIRFAADKSPYRTQMYLMFSDQRAKEGDDGQLYVGVSPDTLTAGFRIYGQGRESRLARTAVPRALEHSAWLAQQARHLGKKYESYWYSTEKGAWTKHAGWPLRPEEWKRLKGWIVRRRVKPARATRPGFPGEVARIFRELFPLYEFTSAAKWKLRAQLREISTRGRDRSDPSPLRMTS